MWPMSTRSTRAAAAAGVALLSLAGGIALAAAPGSPVRGFGDGGKAVVANPGVSNTVSGAALDAEGRILTAGSRGHVLELTRLLPDGSPDPGFGDGGQAIADYGDRDAVATDVAADGELILASGFTGFDAGDSDAYFRFLVAAFTEDGSPAAAFGDDGAAVVPLGYAAIANAIALDADGRVVAAGETAPGFLAADDMAVALLTPDGELDRSFSGNGRWTGGRRRADEEILDVAIDRAGRVVFAGFGSANGRTHMVVGRLRRSGRVERNFGRRGFATAFVDSASIATSLYIDRHDRPVIAGYVQRGEEERFALARFRNLTGRPDRRFGGDGQVTLNPRGSGRAAGIAPGRGGLLIVTGSSQTGRASTSDMAAAQVTAKGALDARFGRGGWRYIDFDGGRDVAAGALTGPGPMILPGTAEIGAQSGRPQNEVAVAALRR